MKKGNVLVIGNSGVGKSTLINAVLGENVAKTGWGTHGITDRINIYESKNAVVPFRLIDTIGFTPNFFKSRQAINAVRDWSKSCAKAGMENSQVNVIWFCVDGTRRKLFDEDIKNLINATSIWKSVPIIVVITKSYSVNDRKDNIAMVNQILEKKKRNKPNIVSIIPVVAETYVLNDNAFAPPEGISELIEKTNDLLPDGFKAADKDMSEFVLSRKRVLAQSVVAFATASAVVVGAVPIPFPDALILGPTELTEINTLASIYGIKQDEKGKAFLKSIVEVGTVSTAAKAIINALKTIPGINLAASIINSITAGVIVAALGEASIFAFEQVYLGNKSVTEIDWVKSLIEGKLSVKFLDQAKPILNKLSNMSGKNDIIKAATGIVKALSDVESSIKKIK